MRQRAIRSGDEPSHARSPLRLRLILAILGFIWSMGGVIVFAAKDVPVLALGFAAVAVPAPLD